MKVYPLHMSSTFVDFLVNAVETSALVHLFLMFSALAVEQLLVVTPEWFPWRFATGMIDWFTNGTLPATLIPSTDVVFSSLSVHNTGVNDLQRRAADEARGVGGAGGATLVGLVDLEA